MQHIFKGSVCTFSLAIGLRVKCRGHSKFGPDGLKECLPKLASKLGILVRDNGFGKAMKSENMIEE